MDITIKEVNRSPSNDIDSRPIGPRTSWATPFLQGGPMQEGWASESSCVIMGEPRNNAYASLLMQFFLRHFGLPFRPPHYSATNRSFITFVCFYDPLAVHPWTTTRMDSRLQPNNKLSSIQIFTRITSLENKIYLNNNNFYL